MNSASAGLRPSLDLRSCEAPDGCAWPILLSGAVGRFDLAPETRYRVAMTTSALSDRIFAAFLFDMDGTIINSMDATERAWSAWARRHGIDVETFLPTIHGVRGIETISRLQLPGLDPHAEARDVLLAEIEDVAGVAAIAGAASFLASLPENRWAIVTSAPRELAIRRLGAAGLPLPDVFITGEDVEHGKPAPDCFLLAAQRLGLPIEDCLVFRGRAGRHPGRRSCRCECGCCHGHPSIPF
jgi:mannitol-1-/sugar-/sorbitol-6-phosphatase